MRNGTRIHFLLNCNYVRFGIHLYILIYQVKNNYASTKIYYVGSTVCIIAVYFRVSVLSNNSFY